MPQFWGIVDALASQLHRSNSRQAMIRRRALAKLALTLNESVALGLRILLRLTICRQATALAATVAGLSLNESIH